MSNFTLRGSLTGSNWWIASDLHGLRTQRKDFPFTSQVLDSSFDFFAVRGINHPLLAFILDETLSEDLASLSEGIFSEVSHRMQADFNCYAISKSTFFFFLAVKIATSRAVDECDALKLIHDRGPSLSIVAIAQAFEATEATRIVRGKTTNNKPVDRLNQAMTTLDPTAWGELAARAGAYARTGLAAPVNGNTTK